MQDKRLPVSKYMRQLELMRVELKKWQDLYREAQLATDNPWLERRMEARWAALADIVADIAAAERNLAELPRTSI